MITGFVFNYQRKNIGSFFKNLLLKLVVPWLSLTVPFVLLRPGFWGFSSVLSGFYGIISGSIQWYMPCCILAEIIWFFINRYAKKPKWIVLISLVIFCLGLLAASHNCLNFAMFNRALIVQFYILLGYLFKRNEDQLSSIKGTSIILAFLIYILLGLISLKIWPDSGIDVHMNSYYNYPLCFTMIALGGFALFSAGKAIFEKKRYFFPRIVLFIGQNTIVFYLLHSYNIAALVKVFSLLHIQLSFYPFAIVKTAFGLFMCGIEALILIRCFPWAIGKQNAKSNRCASEI